MAVVQSTYPTGIRRGVPGMLRSQAAWDGITRILETAAGAGFGVAVSQGATDKGCILGGTLAGFLGVTQKDITLPVTRDRTVDMFAEKDNVGVLTKGEIYVTAGSDVDATANPGVYFVPATGVFTAVATNNIGPIPGARWLDSGLQGDILGIRLAGH